MEDMRNTQKKEERDEVRDTFNALDKYLPPGGGKNMRRRIGRFRGNFLVQAPASDFISSLFCFSLLNFPLGNFYFHLYFLVLIFHPIFSLLFLYSLKQTSEVGFFLGIPPPLCHFPIYPQTWLTRSIVIA
jgi:hypothetical protein